MSPKIRIGSKEFKLPKSQIARMTVGLLLIIGGILGFLPILGFWMIPLGLLVLSHDLPSVRRWRRNITLKWNGRGRKLEQTRQNRENSN
ncbi:MAG: hypothetical protein GY927_20820 [bacterium]|nr:hypothetical protein [bacterium]